MHLTTLMCPRHRQAVLSDVRLRLKAGLPVRLVSTSLIEAGVDISFPEVWRATTGLDSIAQAADRCNREGERESGRVVVFTPAEAKPPPVLEVFIQAARTSFRRHPDDVLGLDAVETYFSEVYWQKAEAMDAARLASPADAALRHDRCAQPFRRCGRAMFRSYIVFQSADCSKAKAAR